MISAFAEILRYSLPSSAIICRWGGDEFTVMIPKTNRSRMMQHTEAIFRATEEYNAGDPEAKLHYAVGEAMSEDHPGMTRQELFHVADEKMYQNKQEWYTEKRKRENPRNRSHDTGERS